MFRLVTAAALVALGGLAVAGCGGRTVHSVEGAVAGGAGAAEPSASGSSSAGANNDGGSENSAASEPFGGTAGAMSVATAGAAEGGSEAASGGAEGTATAGTAGGPVMPFAGAAGAGSGTVGCGPVSGGTGSVEPRPGAGEASIGGLGGGGIRGGAGGAGGARGAETTSAGTAGTRGVAPVAGAGGARGAETTSAGTAGNRGVAPVAGAAGHEPCCADYIQNGDETDIDCGGGDCEPCADLMMCEVGADCNSGVCSGSLCQTPACNDGVKNGTEACDGDDLADATCSSLGLGTGTLGCSDSCEFVTSGCGSAWTCGDPLVDARDDRVYATIALGGFCWMASNLDIGERIQTNQAQSATDRIQKYCYADDETMCSQFGGLYQWDHAMQYSEAEGATGICPAGWRIPTDQNWKELEIALGMDPAVADQDDWRGAG
ncbi:MAG: hypothetical protein JW940_07890, partial [Polyangiaceae bacterium]|nr:hypothetical protein [Polyangiaceae bacterium]